MPLGPIFIAAALRARGHDVAILDRYSELARNIPVRTSLQNYIRDFRPDLIGLSTISPLIHDTVESVRIIRLFFDGSVIAGGHHATALPETSLQKIPGLNGLVVGEGEEALAHIADGEALHAIPGVWWRHDELICSPAVPYARVKDLDTLPFPAYDLLDMGMYTRRSMMPIRGHYLSTASLLTSRGCRFRCRFCSEHMTYGNGVRFHSPEYVIEWIRYLLSHYPGVDGLYFHDNNFMADTSRAAIICEEMIRAGLNRRVKWAIQARADQLDPAILRLLRKAGCTLVEIGVEAADDNLLIKYNKQSVVADNDLAIRLCKKADLAVHANMLTRVEGETLSDLTGRLQWLKKVRPDTFSWVNLMINPGTDIYCDMGELFFENSDWTADNIELYYKVDKASSLDPKVRQEWMEKYHRPYAVACFRKTILRRNGIFMTILFALRRLKEKIWGRKPYGNREGELAG